LGGVAGFCQQREGQFWGLKLFREDRAHLDLLLNLDLLGLALHCLPLLLQPSPVGALLLRLLNTGTLSSLRSSPFLAFDVSLDLAVVEEGLGRGFRGGRGATQRIRSPRRTSRVDLRKREESKKMKRIGDSLETHRLSSLARGRRETRSRWVV
jgi:hypothetical protein